MCTEIAQGLREWAQGSYTAEAAVEMLIRAFGGRFAAAGWPWVVSREEVHRGSLRTDHWLDADELLNKGSTGALSGGEQLYLRFVASMFGQSDLDLSDIARLDRDLQALVLAGLSHAGGSHQHHEMVTREHTDAVTGEKFRTTLPLRGRTGPPLFPWPGETPAGD